MGRHTEYKEEYNQRVYKLALLGLTDVQIAEQLEVSEKTLNTWKNQFPSFLQSLNAGKIESDSEIAQSLYHKAKGGLITKETREVFDEKGQKVELVSTKEHAPDTASAFIWLKNRQRGYWKDRHEIETTVNVFNVNIDASKRQEIIGKDPFALIESNNIIDVEATETKEGE